MINPIASKRRTADWLVGLSIYGAAIVGVAGLVGGLVSFIEGRTEAAGTCLIAGAVAFGALANALFRS